MNPKTPSHAVTVGGVALVAAAILFVAAFSYLAATFDYPDVLDRTAAEVLPRLLGLGTAGRVVWVGYALLPLLLIPAGVGVSSLLRDRTPGTARMAELFAVLSGLFMTLGLMRWPSIQWELARGWAAAAEPERATLGVLFDGLNAYLGNCLGEFAGEMCLNLFFGLAAWGWLRAGARPRWIGMAGIAAAGIGAVAMFRNATPAVGAIAEVNNYVLPLWMIVFGVALARARALPPDAEA